MCEDGGAQCSDVLEETLFCGERLSFFLLLMEQKETKKRDESSSLPPPLLSASLAELTSPIK